jgi:anti-anti-sigma factor
MVPFKLSAADVWPGCREITLQGELDLAVCRELEAALEGAVARCDHVLVDMTACDFIDGRCLAILVRAHERLRHRGRRLSLLGAHGQVRRLLSVTGAIESELSVVRAGQLPNARRPAAAMPVR